MPCTFCNSTGLVLKNCYAGDVQPYDNELIHINYEFFFDQGIGITNRRIASKHRKMVKCHMCNGGGPSADPEVILIPIED